MAVFSIPNSLIFESSVLSPETGFGFVDVEKWLCVAAAGDGEEMPPVIVSVLLVAELVETLVLGIPVDILPLYWEFEATRARKCECGLVQSRKFETGVMI